MSCLTIFLMFMSTCVATDFPKDSVSVDKIIELLDSEDYPAQDGRKLRDLGSKSFQAYTEILNNKSSPRKRISRVLNALYYVDGDKTCFVDLTIAWIHDIDPFIRADAVRLLERIGSPRECVVLMALLRDPTLEVRTAAATSISKIGDRKELIALKLWVDINSADVMGTTPEVVRHVKECIRRMQERLQNEAKPKK